jgi:hypothetical protein
MWQLKGGRPSSDLPPKPLELTSEQRCPTDPREWSRFPAPPRWAGSGPRIIAGCRHVAVRRQCGAPGQPLSAWNHWSRRADSGADLLITKKREQ